VEGVGSALYTSHVKIYCSGIGGIGLSAYAALQRSRGQSISGSDHTESALIADLRSQGIAVTLTQDGSAVPSDADLFVYSEAIPADAPERRRAAELKIPTRSYFAALGDLSRASRVIAVCGTHGKSSTTAMSTRVLLEAGLDPTIIVGTKLSELEGRNWRKGAGDLFLLEACEYRRSFLHLSPDIILLTTADGDHFDAFRSMEDYRQAFIDFIDLLPADGVVLTHMGDPDCAVIVRQTHRRSIDVDGLALPTLSVPGAHMQRNAQLVLGLSDVLALDRGATLRALKGYAGCWRRMEVKGTIGDDIVVIDDYGHHPTEVRATVGALHEAYGKRRLVVVFQPHMHDRTLKLYDAFTKAFYGADLVVIADVYEARKDVETARVDLKKFVQDIVEGSGVATLHGGSLTAVEQKLKGGGFLQPHDVVLFLGAGDITTLASAMME